MCATMLWIWQDTYTNPRFGQRSVSAGSLRNAVQLLLDEKPVTLYHRREDDVIGDHFTHQEFRSICELEKFVQGLDGIVQRRYTKIVKDELEFRMEQQHFDL